MPREILVFGPKTFQISVPDGSRITFGPWSPPGEKTTQYSDKALAGTLRIYQGPTKTSEDVIAVFSGVTGFRDLGLNYREQVAIEQGATIWKSDENGYERDDKVSRKNKWVTPEVPLLGEADDEDAPPSL